MVELERGGRSGRARLPLLGVLPLAVALLAVLFLVVHFDLKPVLGDEGVLAMDAWRITRGEVPQRDFFQLIPPLAAYLQAGAFLALGPSVFGLRLAGLLMGLALLTSMWFATRRLLSHPLFRALPLVVLIPFGVGAWPFASHHWLADLLLLLSLLSLLRALEHKQTWLGLLGGAFLGLACATLQDQGGYALLGLLALFFLFLGDVDARRVLGAALGGAALSLALILLPLTLASGPGPLFRDWVLFPLQHYHGAAGNQVSWAKGLEQVLDQWDPTALRIAPVYTSMIALASMLLYASPPLCVIALALAWRRRWESSLRLGLLAVFSIAFLGAAFHRWSLMNLIWAAPLPAIVGSMALERLHSEGSAIVRRMVLGFSVFVLLVFCGFGLLRARVATQSWRLHPLVAPAGTYRLFNPRECRELQEFVDQILRRVPPDEGAFCVGYCPLVNFLTGHPNPTRYNLVLRPHYTSDEQAREWEREVDEKHVLWGFAERDSLDPRDSLGEFLLERYEVAWESDRYVLFRRRE